MTYFGKDKSCVDECLTCWLTLLRIPSPLVIGFETPVTESYFLWLVLFSMTTLRLRRTCALFSKNAEPQLVTVIHFKEIKASFVIFYVCRMKTLHMVLSIWLLTRITQITFLLWQEVIRRCRLIARWRKLIISNDAKGSAAHMSCRLSLSLVAIYRFLHRQQQFHAKIHVRCFPIISNMTHGKH